MPADGEAEGISVQASVAWGDCDPAGVIFYPTLFAWMDRAAHALFRDVGVSREQELPPAESLFPVVEARAEFLAPALLDDDIDVCVSVTTIGTTSFGLAYEIRRPSDATVIARGWEQRVRVMDEAAGVFVPRPLDDGHRAGLSSRMSTAH